MKKQTRAFFLSCENVFRRRCDTQKNILQIVFPSSFILNQFDVFIRFLRTFFELFFWISSVGKQFFRFIISV